MALKIMGFIFVIQLAIGITAPNQIKNMPFDVNEIIGRVSHQQKVESRISNSEIQPFDQGEFLIDTTFFCGPSLVEQFAPVAAFDGTNYLVVWADYRNGSSDIYGSRISPSGVILDSANIAISTAIGDQESLEVVFGDSNYLVVWDDYRNGNLDIYGARVSPSGMVLDPNGIPISTAPYGQYYHQIAFSGSNYLIVWEDGRNGSPGYWDVYGARLSLDGVVLDPAGIPISTANLAQMSPQVAFDGTNYFIVWYDSRNGSDDNIYGERLTTDGVVLDPNGFPISTAPDYQRYPEVVFGDSNYLVVWNDYRNGNLDIYGTRVSPFGTVLDPNGIPISTAPYEQYYHQVAFSGSNYLIVWEDGRNGIPGEKDVYCTRLNLDGVVLDPAGIPISTANLAQMSPQVTFDGTNYFIVWYDRRSGLNDDIYGARLTMEGVVLDPNGFPISTAPDYQRYPQVVFGDSNYLVVWSDNRNDNLDIYGTRVSTTGTVLDSLGIIFSISTTANTQSHSKISFDGTNYFVVWADDRNGSDDIYGSRISPEGAILDPGGIPISTADYTKTPCHIIFAGNQYLVIWTDYRNGNSDIYGARISTDGIVLDTAGIPISIAIDDQEIPQVVFDGINYFVVWEDYRNGDSDIYGARITLAGEVLEPDGIPISTSSYSQYSPQVTFGGNTYFVVWEDHRNSYSNTFGTRITLSGEVLEPDGIPIATGTYSQYSPQLTFGGNTYFVIWEDYRSHFYSDIYGVRITQAGEVLEPDGIPISTAIYDQHSPQVTFGGTTYFVVWKDSRNNNYYDIYGARVTLAGVVLEPEGIPISTDTTNYLYEYPPLLILSGNDYFIVWENYTNGSYDIHGARVNQAGVVIDSFIVTNQPGDQLLPALAAGNGNQVLIAYEGWTDEYQGNLYNTYRIWGKFYPFAPGITNENSKVKMGNEKLFEVYPNPSRSFLAVRLPQTADHQPLKIFDVSGKLVKVADEVTSPQSHKQEVRISLKGINPGIYFLKVGKETKKFLVVK